MNLWAMIERKFEIIYKQKQAQSVDLYSLK